jgi:hypothetical protein
VPEGIKHQAEDSKEQISGWAAGQKQPILFLMVQPEMIYKFH